MARKKTSKSEPSNSRIIKLRLTDDESRVVRMAAASHDQQPGVYARAVVVEQAHRELRRVRDELNRNAE